MPHSSTAASVSIRPEMTAALMAQTGLDETCLIRLVHRFYEKIRSEPELGPIFTSRIHDWPTHLAKMVDFWSSVALLTGRYSGTPMRAHAHLSVEWPHFEKWLSLFRETAAETCSPAGARHVVERAERIARSLNMGIEDARGVGLSLLTSKLENEHA